MPPVRLGSPRPYNSRHLRRPEHFQNSLPPQYGYGWGRFFFQKWFRRGPLRAGHGIPSSAGGISILLGLCPDPMSPVRCCFAPPSGRNRQGHFQSVLVNFSRFLETLFYKTTLLFLSNCMAYISSTMLQSYERLLHRVGSGWSVSIYIENLGVVLPHLPGEIVNAIFNQFSSILVDSYLVFSQF